MVLSTSLVCWPLSNYCSIPTRETYHDIQTLDFVLSRVLIPALASRQFLPGLSLRQQQSSGPVALVEISQVYAIAFTRRSTTMGIFFRQRPLPFTQATFLAWFYRSRLWYSMMWPILILLTNLIPKSSFALSKIFLLCTVFRFHYLVLCGTD